MRRITKGPEPEDLRTWRQTEVPENRTYDNMPKLAVKRQMLTEQGYLCAYTMQRISTTDDCQIEHIVPRNQDRSLETAYGNMLACSPSNRPGSRSQRGRCPFGAEEKDQARVDESNFVSPLREDVERRFHYEVDGSVTHLNHDIAAESTIGILQLNHEQLMDLRRAAIEERILDLETGLTAEEAEHLSQTILAADPGGRIAEFCLAISHVAAWYAGMVGGGN